jgi:hypothetical protein
MDYFVAVEPNYQHFWQIELLIESFKLLKMQDQLFVAIMGSPSELPVNLLNHPRKIFCADFNETFKFGYPPINRLACLKASLDYLSPQFAVLHTDMAIVGPIPEIKHNLCFVPYPQPSANVFYFPSWVSFDGVTVFNKVSKEFFDYAISAVKSLMEMYDCENVPIWAVALNLAIRQFNFSVIASNLETPLTLESNVLPPIIHYKTGFPPHFSKNYSITDDPYNTLISFNPNFCTNFLREIVLSYKNNLDK